MITIFRLFQLGLLKIVWCYFALNTWPVDILLHKFLIENNKFSNLHSNLMNSLSVLLMLLTFITRWQYLEGIERLQLGRDNRSKGFSSSTLGVKLPLSLIGYLATIWNWIYFWRYKTNNQFLYQKVDSLITDNHCHYRQWSSNYLNVKGYLNKS